MLSQVNARTRAISRDALLLALALLLSYIEHLVPLSFALPGMKLGLANLAVMYTYLHVGPLHGATVSLLRVVLVSLLFGQASSFLFALLGAACALLVLFFLSRTDKISRVGLSVACAAAHGVGQIAAAVLLYGTVGVVSYLPFMLLASLPFGGLLGFLLYLVERAMPGEGER